ncbi:MAG TPA: hypothetical protein VGK87_13300, partial [Anaerolineae bacterium]
MWKPFRVGKREALGLLGIAILLTSGCSAGVTQAEFDKAKNDLASQEQKAAAFQKELSNKTQELEALKQKQASQPAQAANTDGVTLLVGARMVTPAPPGPTPTALPPGFTPPPKPG